MPERMTRNWRRMPPAVKKRERRPKRGPACS